MTQNINIDPTASEAGGVFQFFAQYFLQGTNLILLLTSIISTSAAIYLFFKNSKQKRIKASVDYFVNTLWDTEYIKAVTDFKRSLISDGGLSGKIKDKSTQIETRVSISTYLSENELIAICINRRVFDEETCRDWLRGIYIEDWDVAKEFIKASRIENSNDAIMANFEELAVRWKNSPAHPIWPWKLRKLLGLKYEKH